MFFSLMTARRFAPLFWCQFFSAFNDNFLKTSLVFMILFRLAGGHAQLLITLAGAVFIFPFFILSALGGEIADRFDKARVAERLKLAEIAVAAVAVAGFWSHSIAVLFVALFLFGVISALFGPIKYGILPDHLTLAELPTANALVEAATFIAILTGTIAGGLAARGGGDPASFAGAMMLLALACWGSARLIPASGRAAPELRIRANIAASTLQLLRATSTEPRQLWAALVVSWFWLVGIVMLALLPPLAKDHFGGTEDVLTAFLAIFSISIGIGSALASLIARGRIVLVPVPVAAVLIGLFALDLGFVAKDGGALTDLAALYDTPLGWRVVADLAGVAIAGGLFIVPTFTAIQHWAGAERRARTVAAVNVLNAAFMVAASILLAALQAAGLSTGTLLMLLGGANVAVAAAIFLTLPRAA
jgi:acyl-[acyl-carrier-protein]-phospholipid O-acyltransferase/long-chain-fatty-acid--[acyl-carrier-protein] ligase